MIGSLAFRAPKNSVRFPGAVRCELARTFCGKVVNPGRLKYLSDKIFYSHDTMRFAGTNGGVAGLQWKVGLTFSFQGLVLLSGGRPRGMICTLVPFRTSSISPVGSRIFDHSRQTQSEIVLSPRPGSAKVSPAPP